MLKVGKVENGIRLDIKVQPRSSHNAIIGEHEGMLKIKLTAPPVEGKANKALQAFLADKLRVSKKNIILVKGESSHTKIVDIIGIDETELMKRLHEQEN